MLNQQWASGSRAEQASKLQLQIKAQSFRVGSWKTEHVDTAKWRSITPGLSVSLSEYLESASDAEHGSTSVPGTLAKSRSQGRVQKLVQNTVPVRRSWPSDSCVPERSRLD